MRVGEKLLVYDTLGLPSSNSNNNNNHPAAFARPERLFRKQQQENKKPFVNKTHYRWPVYGDTIYLGNLREVLGYEANKRLHFSQLHFFLWSRDHVMLGSR